MNLGLPPLLWAIEYSQFDIAKELIKCPKIDININDGFKCNALINTSHYGDIEIVKELLQRSEIEVNKTDKHGDTALIYASANGHCDVVKELLKFPGINVYQSSEYGNTAISVALNLSHIEIFKIIKERLIKDIGVTDLPTDIVRYIIHDFWNFILKH
jgi:ankyrin repeat protein